MADGSCVRKRAGRPNHVWSYDFVFERTHDGRPLRMLTLVDEFTRECLTDRFADRGPPEYIRSDNGAEFTATAIREWLANLEVKTLYIAPGSPWENGYIESFKCKLRDELLDREIFYTPGEAKVLTARWRWPYNPVRPQSSLGYKAPAPKAIEIASLGLTSETLPALT